MPLLTLLLALATAGLLLPTTAHAGAILHAPTYVGLGSGLVGFWSFDGSDIAQNATGIITATDRSGNVNNGTTTSAATTPGLVRGKLGQALSFDGGDDTVSIPDSVTLDVSTQITVATWVRLRGYTGTAQNAGSKSSSVENNGYIFPRWDSLGTTFGEYFIHIVITGWVSAPTINWNTISDPFGWHHVAKTYDGAEISLYVDGVNRGTNPQTGTIMTNSNQFAFGAQPGYGEFFNGEMDDYRIYNRALSADEIKRLYKIGATAKFGVASNSGSLTSGLVGYWSFDGQDIAKNGSGLMTITDGSGTGNKGTSVSAAATPAMIRGKLGQALNFDGADDFVSILDAPSINPTTALTISTWIYRSTDLNNMIPVNHESNFRLISTEAGTNNRITARLGNGWANLLVGTNDIPLNQWTNIALTFDDALPANQVKMYLNGQLDAQLTQSGTLSGSNDPLLLGTYQAGTFQFNGSLDDLRIYNRALSADEIKRLYKIGATAKYGVASNSGSLASGLVGYWSFDGPDIADVTAYDRSGQGNNGTLTNGPTRVRGKLGQALSFDGTDKYVDTITNDLISPSTGTFSAWLRPTGPSDSQAQSYHLPRILGEAGGNMGIHRGDISGTDRIWIFNWDGNEDKVGASYNPEEWTHIVWVHANGVLFGYKNGQLFGSTASGNTSAMGPIRIGSSYQGVGGFFTGQIDDVRVYNRALSADEIKRLYNMGR